MNWIKRGKFHYWAVSCFIILTLFGVILRYMQIYSLTGLNYLFILHAHSHFAFAGWVFFSIAVLFADKLSGDTYSSNLKYVFIFSLISAFGMLISFSLEGYKLTSIAFSTLFILVTYWFTYLVLKSKELKKLNAISRQLTFAALAYVCLSSLGPFALGPIMVSGHRNSTVYQNAIYFYLHFQMNGWMLLAVLGLFTSDFTEEDLPMNKKTAFWLTIFILSAIPLFLIFTLWTKPPTIIYLLALAGAILCLLSWIKLLFYFKHQGSKCSTLVKAAFSAITIKLILQVLVSFPFIGEWTFSNRNLIIGYIHLITLGSIMPLILDGFVKRGFFTVDKQLIRYHWYYISGVVFYLILLFLQPLLALFSILIPEYHFILFLLSLYFLMVGFFYLRKLKSYRQI